MTDHDGTMAGLSEWASKEIGARDAEIERLRAEMDAWQSLDGTNWYQRAKKAEAEIKRLRWTLEQVIAVDETDADIVDIARRGLDHIPDTSKKVGETSDD